MILPLELWDRPWPGGQGGILKGIRIDQRSSGTSDKEHKDDSVADQNGDEEDQVDNEDTDRDDLLRRDCQDESIADEGQGQWSGQVVEVSVARIPNQVDHSCLEMAIE